MVILILTTPAAESDDAEEKQAELREKALEASYDEYKELTTAWRTLDTKAQGNITTAGIFVAASIAYLTKFNPPGLGERVLLLYTVTFLVSCVVLSLLALLVREVAPHYLGDFRRKTVNDMAGETGADFQDGLLRLYNEQADLWESTRLKLVRANKTKGDFLWLAQGSLLLAIFWAGMLVNFKIFSWG
ncbi:MAG: hypothetical protein ABW208_00445 [Pyrinomonadaceae bacterium]